MAMVWTIGCSRNRAVFDALVCSSEDVTTTRQNQFLVASWSGSASGPAACSSNREIIPKSLGGYDFSMVRFGREDVADNLFLSLIFCRGPKCIGIESGHTRAETSVKLTSKS